MKPMKLALCFCVLIVAPVTTAQRPPDPKVETYIPANLTGIIRIEVSRDDKETTITKYNWWPRVEPEVRGVTTMVILVGPDDQIKYGDGNRYHTRKIGDPASVAWVSSADIRRLIFIVERVETDGGDWVLESEDQHANIKAIVERGADALPHAKFIKRE
ncbi:MAG TPA: hypothetical protein VJ464_07010 [Blastocatellia bacterium]|nr:hypothetical protein [Blastocatellia bacterium]